MSLHLKAIFSRLVIEPLPVKRHEGLIELVDNYDKGAKLYKVLDVGFRAGWQDGTQHQEFKVGDIVLIHQNKVMYTEFKGKKYYTVPDDQIIGIWQGEV